MGVIDDFGTLVQKSLYDHSNGQGVQVIAMDNVRLFVMFKRLPYKFKILNYLNGLDLGPASGFEPDPVHMKILYLFMLCQRLFI
jgi:hypothetical protein